MPGIGEKTARELINTIGSIEEIYSRLDLVKKPSVREKLQAGRELAQMSRQLATIRLDVPIDVTLETLS